MFDTHVKRAILLMKLSEVKQATKALSTEQGGILYTKASELLEFLEEGKKPEEIKDVEKIAGEIFKEAEELEITETRIEKAGDMRRELEDQCAELREGKIGSERRYWKKRRNTNLLRKSAGKRRRNSRRSTR